MNPSNVDRAVDCFAQGLACSQAILATYGEPMGLPRAQAIRLAEGFAGGMAGLGETCGAVAGALMVLGLKHGRTHPDDVAAKTATHRRVREFLRQFEARRGSVKCRDLLGCSIDTPERLQAARDQKLFTTVCPGLVRDAAEILEALLDEGLTPEPPGGSPPR
jgi:C_GCAxxG_C_C family probable redox protein